MGFRRRVSFITRLDEVVVIKKRNYKL